MTTIEDRPRPEAGHDRDRDPGGWLAAHRWEMDRGESAWLEALAEFDLQRGWADDGQLSGAEWLMWRTHMARATAYEKLHIAHELRRRPQVRAAFADGRLSYSAVRAITRMEWPDPEVDEALIELATSAPVNDVERMVRLYQLHQGQHRPPGDIDPRRGVRIRPPVDGTATVEIVVEATEAEELAAAVQAFLDISAVDKSAAADATEASWTARRADAFMDLVRTGLAHAGDGHAPGADRYLVHLVQRAGATELLDGTPVDTATADRLACDASRVVHLIAEDGEPLYLGRRTRDWTTAQRRAITVRDRGHCRFPGCQRRHVDIHHLRWWTQGGATDIDNGVLICPHHHTLLHQGFTATGDANHSVTFHRPNGTVLG